MHPSPASAEVLSWSAGLGQSFRFTNDIGPFLLCNSSRNGSVEVDVCAPSCCISVLNWTCFCSDSGCMIFNMCAAVYMSCQLSVWVWAPLVFAVQPAVQNSCIRVGPEDRATDGAKLSQYWCLIRSSTYPHSLFDSPRAARPRRWEHRLKETFSKLLNTSAPCLSQLSGILSESKSEICVRFKATSSLFYPVSHKLF